MVRKKSKKRKSKRSDDIIFYDSDEKALEPEEFEYVLPQKEIDLEAPPFWKRLAAYAIDLAIVYFLFYQIFLMIYLPRVGFPVTDNASQLEAFVSSNPTAYMQALVAVFMGLFLLWVYLSVCEKNLGYTFGKQILHIVTVSKAGKPLTYKQAFLRNLTKSVFFFLLPLDYLGSLFSKNRERISEYLSHTKVIYYKPLNLDYEVPL